MLKRMAEIDCFVAQEKLLKATRLLCEHDSPLFVFNVTVGLLEAKQWIDKALEHLKDDSSPS